MTDDDIIQLSYLIEEMESIHRYDHDREDYVSLYASDGGWCLSFDSSDIKLLNKILKELR